MENKFEDINVSPYCPCCRASAYGLELIAKLFDSLDKEFNSNSNQIQTELRNWAQNIRDSHQHKLDKLQ